MKSVVKNLPIKTRENSDKVLPASSYVQRINNPGPRQASSEYRKRRRTLQLILMRLDTKPDEGKGSEPTLITSQHYTGHPCHSN